MSPTAKNILRLLRKTPATAKQLAETLGMTRQYIGHEIAALRKKPQKIHVCGWVGQISKEEAVFAAGRGEDAPKPPSAIEIVLRTMQEKMVPMTLNEIADACGLTPQTIGRCVHRIAKETPIHITEWIVANRGPHVPRYAIGEGQDAVKPRTLTAAERVRKYRKTPLGIKTNKRARRRWSKSEAGKEYAKKRSEAKSARVRFEKGGVAAIDPLLAAIMGIR